MTLQMTAREYQEKYGSSPMRTTASGAQTQIPVKMTIDEYNKKYQQVPETITTEPTKSFGQKIKDFFTEATSKSAYDILYQKDADKMNLDTINTFNNSIKTLVERNKSEQDEEMRKKREKTIKNLLEQQQKIAGKAGGEIAGKTTGQLVGQSVMTALELTPFLGFKSLSTAAVKGAIEIGGKIAGKELVKKELEKEVAKKGTSFLTKEFATTLPKTAMVESGLFGTMAGAASEMENKDATFSSVVGNAIKTGAISAVLGLGLAKGGQYIANKLTKKQVESTVSSIEKELETAFPEESKKMVETAVENGASKNEIVSAIKDKKKELSLSVISNTNNEEVISKSLEGIVDTKDIPTLSKALKYVDNEAEVAKMIDEFSPDVQKKKLVEELSLAETDREVSRLIKDKISPEELPKYTKIFKSLKDEATISKVLNELPSVETKVSKQEITPETSTVETPKKFVERDMNEQELATALAKKALERFKPGHPKYNANKKAVGMEFSSLKKRLNGDATVKEIKNTRKQLESNYIGKQVKVRGKKGIVKRNAFGKVGVEIDGKIKFYEKNLVKSKKVSDRDVIQKIIDDAKKELYGKQSIYRINTKIKEEFVETKKQVSNTETTKQPSETTPTSTTRPVEQQKPISDTKTPTKTESPKASKKTETPKKEGVFESAIKTKQKESQFAKDFERKSIEKGILSEPTMVAEYTPGIRKEQAKMVSEVLVDKNKTLRILRGEENLPDGIKDLAFVGGVRKYALSTNDFELADALRRSEFSTKTSEVGSELSMLSGTKSNFDQKVSDIQKARIEAYKEKTGKDADKALKEEIAKFKDKEITEEDMLSFIKEIKC